MNTLNPLAARRPGVIDRVVGLVTPIQPGEGPGALLLAANVFCLLASYYLLKTARESFILSEGGANVKSYAAAAQAAILFVAVPFYGAVASRVSRARLVNGVLLFFAANLLVFRGALVHAVHIGVPFFLWVGIFNVMVVGQFWALANDLYTPERGGRLFPFIGVGASIGALAGARMASALMRAHLQPADLLLLAACGLGCCVLLNRAVAVCTSDDDRTPIRASAEDNSMNAGSGLRLVLSDRYLRMIALLVILVQVVNTTGEYLLGRLVVAHATREIALGTAHGLSKAQLIGLFYGDFFGVVNLVSLLVQLTLVARVFKTIGPSGALFVLPVIAAGSYGLMALMPALGAVRLSKIFENSIDYSLQNTARHALFLPTTREAKYKATQVIDGLCWRLGDVLQAGVVFLGARASFGVTQFAMLNEILVVIWLVLVMRIWREHRARACETTAGEAAAGRELRHELARVGGPAPGRLLHSSSAVSG